MMVNESISELREMCQVSYEDWEEQPWLFRKIRLVSIYLTWGLLHTSISANQTILMGTLIGLMSSAFYSQGKLLIGALLLLFSIIIDYSDGEVARYKNQKSAEGSYLDKFYHFTVHSFIFLGLTIGAQENNSDQLIWICGWISSISIILLSLTRGYIILIVLSIKFRRLLNNIISDETAVNDIQSQVGIIKRETRPIDPLMYKKDNNLNQSKNSRMHRYISYITTFWDFPYFLLLIIIVSIVQYSLSPITYCGYTPLELLIVFFGITTPSLILLFVFNRLVTMKISKKVDELQNDLFYIFSCKNSDH